MSARLAIIALSWACTAALADPMRPLQVSGAASAPAADVSRELARATPSIPALPPLVAIRESADGQRQALLGERWLAAGERIGSVKLLAIHATGVEITDGARRQTLQLLPPLLDSIAAPARRMP